LVDTHRAAFPVYLFAFAASASAPVWAPCVRTMSNLHAWSRNCVTG